MKSSIVHAVSTAVFLGVVTVGLVQPVYAQQGKALAEMSFDSIDTKGKGYLDQGDMEEARKGIFSSMDADENKSIELSEMLAWDFGFQNIAEDQNKQLAYTTALKVVFSFWDRNGDGKITNTEHRKAILRDFERADLNDNAVLEKSEFIGGFSMLVAIRAALKPE